MSETLRVVNPATGGTLREVPSDTPADVARKHEAARAGQKRWAALPLAERRAKLERFRTLVRERLGDLARTLTLEVGKPIAQSRNELKALDGRLAFFLENVERATADELVHEEGGLRERITQEPLGVVGNISAWNYPWFVGSNVFFPALLTGNAVLYKPSEFATLTGLAIADLMKEAGVPDDVFLPVIGGPATGQALLDQRLDGFFFTGSYATGRRIAEAAARHLSKVQLELGGKDPVYVADDVDVEAVAAGVADGAFYNNGQSCCSVERIYVHERIHARFVEAFVAEVKKFKVGDPLADDTYIGPLARPVHLEVLEEQVADAKAKGARLLTGGHRLERAGAYYAPTVFDAAPQDSKLMREETFGPLIGLRAVRDDAEALALMNDTDYGLTAAVYTNDPARAEKLLAGVNAGSAYWNCCDRVSPRLPWSGRGHSGIGSTLGFAGIRTFVQPKAWHLKGGA